MPLLSYIISAICLLLLIIFSIVILSLTNPFFRRVNGLFCSTLTLLEDLINGFGTQYPSHTSEWNGLNHVIDRFIYSDELLKTIDDEYMNATFGMAQENCEKETSCVCNLTELEIDKDLWDIYFFIIYAALDIPTHIGKMKGGLTILDVTKVDVGDDIYDFLHDVANRHIKNPCLAIFVLTLIIGVIGLIFLSLYYFLKNEIYHFVYIVIWSLSMFFMILAILVSVLFGVLGYVTREGVQIIHYTLSSYNLLSDDPIFFKSKNLFISSMIKECANDFLDSLGDDILSSKNESDTDLNEIMDELKTSTCSAETKDSLETFYRALYNGTIITLNATGTLLNIKCRFAKNDKNIILNELNSAGKRATVLSAFQFLVGILLGISVLFGILFIHKYKDRLTPYENRGVCISK